MRCRHRQLRRPSCHHTDLQSVLFCPAPIGFDRYTCGANAELFQSVEKGGRYIFPTRNVRFWPILLKKSVMVGASKKYAFEIEIFTFGRGFRTRISHSRVQKRRFHQSMIRRFGQADFFNRIGRFLPVACLASCPVWFREKTNALGELNASRLAVECYSQPPAAHRNSARFQPSLLPGQPPNVLLETPSVAIFLVQD
jgi:hypothetical protein